MEDLTAKFAQLNKTEQARLKQFVATNPCKTLIRQNGDLDAIECSPTLVNRLHLWSTKYPDFKAAPPAEFGLGSWKDAMYRTGHKLKTPFLMTCKLKAGSGGDGNSQFWMLVHQMPFSESTKRSTMKQVSNKPTKDFGDYMTEIRKGEHFLAQLLRIDESRTLVATPYLIPTLSGFGSMMGGKYNASFLKGYFHIVERPGSLEVFNDSWVKKEGLGERVEDALSSRNKMQSPFAKILKSKSGFIGLLPNYADNITGTAPDQRKLNQQVNKELKEKQESKKRSIEKEPKSKKRSAKKLDSNPSKKRKTASLDQTTATLQSLQAQIAQLITMNQMNAQMNATPVLGVELHDLPELSLTQGQEMPLDPLFDSQLGGFQLPPPPLIQDSQMPNYLTQDTQ